MHNEFIIELPQLNNAFDPDALWNGCQSNESHINESYGVKCWEVKPDQKEVAHIFSQINQDIMEKPLIGWLMYKYQDKWLKPHIDKDRDAILMFPIEPSNYKISFLDNEQDLNTVYEHTYQCPTIVNSNQLHCVYDHGIERKFFQISLFFKDYSWDNVINYVSNGQLLHQTVQ